MIARDTASYERQLSAFRLAYSKAGSITSIGLVLAGVGLDYFSYPEWLTEFFLLRLLVACLTLGILMLLYTRVGAQQVRVLTMTWLVLPQVMIAWMKRPYWTCASVVGIWNARSAKLMPRVRSDRGGVMMLVTSEFVIAVKAAPITTPIARSNVPAPVSPV